MPKKKRKQTHRRIYQQVILECVNCQQPFVSYKKDAKFCTDKCDKIFHSDAALSTKTEQELIKTASKFKCSTVEKSRRHLDTIYRHRDRVDRLKE